MSELTEFQNKPRSATKFPNVTSFPYIIGKLSFACKVVPAGRIFLRWLLDLAHSVHHYHEEVYINEEALLDIQWWLSFASQWNGKAFFLEPSWTPPEEFQLYTDASSSYNQIWCILGRGMVLRHLVTHTSKQKHRLEGLVCHSGGLRHMECQLGR